MPRSKSTHFESGAQEKEAFELELAVPSKAKHQTKLGPLLPQAPLAVRSSYPHDLLVLMQSKANEHSTTQLAFPTHQRENMCLNPK
jgi:hypothetical protein